MTRTQGTASPTTRRMIASVITSRKRATRPCTMTSPLHQVPAVCPEKGVNLDLLCALALVLDLTQAAGATKNITSNNMIASQAQRPNVGVCTPRTIMTDITITRTRGIAFLPPSLLQRQGEVIAPRNRESCQQNLMTWIHLKIWIHLMSWIHLNVWICMSHYVSLFQIKTIGWLIVALN